MTLCSKKEIYTKVDIRQRIDTSKYTGSAGFEIHVNTPMVENIPASFSKNIKPAFPLYLIEIKNKLRIL